MHKRSESDFYTTSNLHKENTKYSIKKYKLLELENKIKDMNVSTKHNSTQNNTNIMNTLNSINPDYKLNTKMFNNTQFSSIMTNPNFKTTINMKTRNDEPVESLNNYGTRVSEMFDNYRLDSLPPEKRKYNKLDMLNDEEKRKVKANLKPKNRYKSVENFDQIIKTTMTEGIPQEYCNPIDSLNILKKNNSILNNIKANYTEREMALVTQTIFQISKDEYIREKIPKKMKVSNVNHNILEPISNDNHNIEKKETKRSVKSMGSIHIRELDNENSGNSYVELYASYIYGNKNFPEGRDQFSLTNDMFDVILFGGIVSNQNHIIWSLDPSKNIKN